MPPASPVLSVVMPFRGKSDIDFALQFATAIAVRELRANPGLPLLYRSGVRWKRDKCNAPGVPGACERFLSPLQVLRERKVADCDDLGPWRCAELLLGKGTRKDTKARAIAIPSPGIGWHVVVRRGDGSIEDPSKVLGMP
jgi:hypothetical protein